MNRKLIQKVLDELNKEVPKLDYVRGILETILESMPESATYVPKLTPSTDGTQPTNLLTKVDFGSITTE